MFFTKLFKSVLGQFPLHLEGSKIIIHSREIGEWAPWESRPVVPLEATVPTLSVFEDADLLIQYRLEPLETNPDLTGQYLHTSIRVMPNLGLAIDGLISTDPRDPEKPQGEFVEGVRFQPVFLTQAQTKNDTFTGRGLFERGLHVSWHVTPGTVRESCVCDFCRESFTLQHFHAGLMDAQYFYCDSGTHTLIVNLYDLPDCPAQLQEEVDPAVLRQVEEQLPKCQACEKPFKYYNPLRCPACGKPYIDFERFPEIRPREYYGHYLINQYPQSFKEEQASLY